MTGHHKLRGRYSYRALTTTIDVRRDGPLRINDAVSATDVPLLVFPVNPLDTTLVLDSPSIVTTFVRSFAESVGTLDGIAGIPAQFNDSVIVTDSVVRDVTKNPADTATGVDAAVRAVSTGFADTASPTDVVAKTPSITFADATAGATDLADVQDPFFPNVSLLLHGDGAAAGHNAVYTDSGPNALTLTPSGAIAQGSFSPYAPSWAIELDGASYLSVANSTGFDIGTGDFTLELFLCLLGDAPPNSDTERYASLINCMPTTFAGATGWELVLRGNATTTGTGIEFTGVQSGSFSGMGVNTSVSKGVWHHLAVVRSGTVTTFYLDGVAVSSNTLSNQNLTSGGHDMKVGRLGITGLEHPFTGKLSNVRLVKGTALYVSNFTPPSANLTAVSGTSVLLGTRGDMRDRSSAALTTTLNSTPKVTSRGPFAGSAYQPSSGGSIHTNGSGWLNISTFAGLAFGTTDFCAECWVYPTSFAANQFLMGTGQGVGAWIVQIASGGQLKFFKSNLTLAITAPANLRLYEWTHIAVERAGGTTTLYVNGVSAGTNADGSDYTVGVFGIGAEANTGNNPCTSYISDVRAVKGSTVYGGAFTPLATPLSTVTNTQLLCNFQAAAIYDHARDGVFETIGNTQLSSTQSKFGGSAIYFDGAGDYMKGLWSPEWDLGTADFTVEGWVYIAGNSAQLPAHSNNRHAVLLSTYGLGASFTNGWIVLISGDTTTTGVNMTFEKYVGGVWEGIGGAAGSTIAAGTWTHFAITRAGTTLRLFLNGTVIGSGVFSNQTIQTGGNPLVVGKCGASTLTAEFNGYLDDVRITRGVARYTANFTPSGTPFPNA